MNRLARILEGTEGEDHASFRARLEGNMSEEDIFLAEFAYDLSKYDHHTHKPRSTGARYFEHVRAATLIMIDELGIYFVNLICAGFLHDSPEDGFLLTMARIARAINPDVARIVGRVTMPAKNDPRFANDDERLHWYHESLVEAKWDELTVKLADRLHNTRTLGSCAVEKRRRKADETVRIYLPLADKLAQVHPDWGRFFSQEISKAIAALRLR